MEENNATITPLPLEVDDKTNHPLDDTKVRSSRGDVPNKPITGPQGMDSPTHAMNTVTYGGEAGRCLTEQIKSRNKNTKVII